MTKETAGKKRTTKKSPTKKRAKAALRVNHRPAPQQPGGDLGNYAPSDDTWADE